MRKACNWMLSASLIYVFLTSGLLVAAQPGVTTPVVLEEDATAPHFAIAPSEPAGASHFVDLAGDPGSTIQSEAIVINTGEISVELNVYVANVATSQFNGGSDFGNADHELEEAALWIDFASNTFTLQPGEERLIPFSITIPEDAAPGQYVAGLIAETSEPFELPGSEQFKQVLRYGTLVTILIPGDLTESLVLGEVSTEDRALIVPVLNSGKYLLRPSGEIEILSLDGEPLISSEVQMGRIFAGDSTHLSLSIPDQFPPGNYLLNLTLTDVDTGASRSLQEIPINVPEAADPRGLFLEEHRITANDTDIAFANVEVTLRNGGNEIPASNVILVVSHDGDLVDEFPLATNQVMVSGENTFTARYIPAGTWESGAYTFEIIVYSVDPQGGQQIELLNEDLDAEIVVP